MTDLTRTHTTEHNGQIARWIVTGPEGAIELVTAMGQFTGWFIHSRTDRYNEGPGVQCEILAAPCWSEALSQTTGRDAYAARLTSEAALYERLEQEYRRVWPAATPSGRCGESVPQAYPETPPRTADATRGI